jgi:hypothetical protein
MHEWKLKLELKQLTYKMFIFMSFIRSEGPKRVTWHPLEEHLEKSAL